MCDIAKWKYVSPATSEGGRYVFLSSNDEALELSKLSLKYENVVGGIMDDLGPGTRTKPEDLKETYQSLKKYNPAICSTLYARIRSIHNLRISSIHRCCEYLDME